MLSNLSAIIDNWVVSGQDGEIVFFASFSFHNRLLRMDTKSLKIQGDEPIVI